VKQTNHSFGIDGLYTQPTTEMCHCHRQDRPSRLLFFIRQFLFSQHVLLLASIDTIHLFLFLTGHIKIPALVRTVDAC